MTQQDQKLTLTVEEAAALLGVSRGKGYELARRGEIPSIRLGRRIVVPRRAVEAMCGAVTTPPHPGADPPGHAVATGAGAEGQTPTAYLCIPVSLNGWTLPDVQVSH